MSIEKMAMTDDQLEAVSGGSILPYRVQNGDTLDAIAQRYNVTREQLMKWNNIQDPASLPIGMQLKIKY